MVTRHERGGIVWTDLESPTRDELRSVMDEFSIGADVEEEIIVPTPYPLMVAAPDYVYLILHFPTGDVGGGARNQEIDLIVGKNFIVTARYEVVRSIQALHKAFEAEELLGIPEENPGPALVERILRHLYQAMSEETERIARTLERIEADIFGGKERKTVHAISEAGRILLRFDTALSRHAEPLDAFLTELQDSFFGKKFAVQAARIKTERLHAASLVGSYRAVSRELRTTNDSLLSSSQNESMKVFTIINVAILPLSFIAAAFTIPAEHAPIIGRDHDFWIIIMVMIVVELLLILFLRLRKWL
ncbi:MAG: CorA family divalent cation transporter [Minisyncoccia bacterium]